MSVHPRLPDWEPRLAAYLSSIHGVPFRYGAMDCMLFVVGAAEAMTGHDHGRGWRGYRTRTEGLRKCRARGFQSHVDLAADFWPEVPLSQARPGDVVELEGQSMGVLQGTLIYALGPQGLGLASRSLALRAFSV